MIPFHVGELGMPALIILTMRYIMPAKTTRQIRNMEDDPIVVQLLVQLGVSSYTLFVSNIARIRKNTIVNRCTADYKGLSPI